MRATPLTVISPIRWWWKPWVRFTWLIARHVPLVAAPLRRLQFIHFARWTLLPGRRLLFLTSFDGSDIQYIEAFVRVVPGRINGLYAGAKGFPGPHRFGPVARYIEEHSHGPVEHFWMAYPAASTRMVGQALALAELYEWFEPRLDTDDPQRFAREWRAFINLAQWFL
jgi:hypothetical protein